jgi:uncharacterized coiled-coil DUF342 family protein
MTTLQERLRTTYSADDRLTASLEAADRIDELEATLDQCRVDLFEALKERDEYRKAADDAASAHKVERDALRELLSEVSQQYTRDDDLPDNLLPRIDAAMAQGGEK